MNLRLTDEQIAFLRSQPSSDPTKIPLALRLVNATRATLAEAAGMSAQQLSAILAGTDIRLSTAHRLAGALGVGVDDLWPTPPASRVDRRRKTATPTKATGTAKRRTRPARSKAAA